MNASQTVLERAYYELRFGFLFDPGRAYVFPCDATGYVDIAALSETGRQNYVQACAAIGREVTIPTLEMIPARRR